MSLALAAPAALFAAVILAGPVIAHLVRRSPTRRVLYGAGLLLQRLRKRVERRRRLHDRVLLLLRLAAIAAICLAIARPELKLPESDAQIGGTGRVIVVLDTSLSMDARDGGEPAFVRAQRAAAELVRSLGDGVRVAAIAAGRPAEPISPGWSTDHALVAALVEGQRQGAGATDLDAALVAARTLLEGEPGEVVVYSDGAGPGTVARAQHSVERLLATGSAVHPRQFAGGGANLVVTEAKYGEGLEGGTVTVTVRNFGPATEAAAKVLLPDGAQMTVFVPVEAGTGDGPAENTAGVTVPRQAAGGVASVSLSDASLPLDDARYFHLPRVGRSRVLVVDGDPGSSPTKSEVYFLERALAPFGGSGATLDVVSAAGAAQLDQGRWRVAVIANMGDPGPIAPALIDFVRGGGALVLTVGDNVSVEAWNRALGGILPTALGRVRDLVSLDAEEGVPLALPDTSTELFAPFSQAGRDGFARVRTRRIFSVEPYDESADVHTLLRYTTGAPALVERQIGAGRVLLWTSTADVGWTNFPLQSVYAPLWQRLLGWLGGEVGGSGARLSGEVGEPVSVSVPAGSELDVFGPDGAKVGLSRAPGALVFTPTVPGAYAVRKGEDPVFGWVAVNTPLAESDVRPDESLAEVEARIDPDRVRRSLPLDGPLLTLAAALLALAGWLGARPVDPTARGERGSPEEQGSGEGGASSEDGVKVAL